MTSLRRFELIIAASGLVALSGCGKAPAERHPLFQREIDQCVAGFVKLMPDEAKRRSACECISDAMRADNTFAGERTEAYEDAHLDKIRACGVSAIPGATMDDPFGILGDEPRAGSARTGGSDFDAWVEEGEVDPVD